MAILPFDNQTPEAGLSQEVAEAVKEAIQSRLGLRPSAEATADAVVRGAITRYAPDIPLSFQPGNELTNVQVTRRRVQLTLNVEIFDQRQGKDAVAAVGPHCGRRVPTPAGAQGRKVALDKLVTDIVDGAQSQW